MAATFFSALSYAPHTISTVVWRQAIILSDWEFNQDAEAIKKLVGSGRLVTQTEYIYT